MVVVSEETGAISAVMGGEMARELDAPELRVTLRDYLSRGPAEEEIEHEVEEREGEARGDAAAGAEIEATKVAAQGAART